MTSQRSPCRPLITLALSVILLAFYFASGEKDEEKWCSLDKEEEHRKRHQFLHRMEFDLGDGEEEFWAYVAPNVGTFYQNQETSFDSTPVTPKFEGYGLMLINLSNQRLQLVLNYDEPEFFDVIEPFSSTGSSDYPGNRFYFAPLDDEEVILQQVETGLYPDHSIHYYDPYHVDGDPAQTEANLSEHLSEEEIMFYRRWRKTVDFGKLYLETTGRHYLVHYPRSRPTHWMWPAEYFGQQHWVMTSENHFKTLPPHELLHEGFDEGASTYSVGERERFNEFRDEGPLNMTLSVLSVAPRVFEIDNFLSDEEVDHILDIASAADMRRSSTGTEEIPEGIDDEDYGISETRTSTTSWVNRESTVIIDAIYRRAADLLRIDEALLRNRDSVDEYPEVDHLAGCHEHLQLVHYDVNEQYLPHHDFGYPQFSEIDDQQQRFATLLLYLNEGMKGGSTTFPRWVNAETFEALKCAPKKGKAVLFYSQLPDGNMDDLSQHAAQPVFQGEKWLINLWVSDPVIEA